MCSTPVDDVECLASWLWGLGVLGVFWAKRVKGIEVVSRNPPTLVLEWQRSGRSKRALLTLCYVASHGCLDSLQGLVGKEDTDILLVTASELAQGQYDRWSKVFVYDVNGSFLDPNHEVSVEVYGPESINDYVTPIVEAVQKSSWGFYKPPPKGVYLLVARLHNGEPVGSAYYNPASSNVDYGIHVTKPYWRRRIGTRLLVEIARLAKSLDHKWVSVVRVVRGMKPTLSDRRAIAFYRANNPKHELNVYRLSMS